MPKAEVSGHCGRLRHFVRLHRSPMRSRVASSLKWRAPLSYLKVHMVPGTPLSELFADLKNDSWRVEHPFSPEIASCQEELFDPKLSRATKGNVLNRWMSSTAYPCIFGRIAARFGKTSILILEERDLLLPDQEIEDWLRSARLQWKREAVDGLKHAFVVVAASSRLAHACPDESLQRFSVRLCELLLRREVEPNTVYRDEVQLRTLAPVQVIRWRAGVDHFAASGDGRWWHDHRIPGGVGFVINSVGHMARTMVEEAARKDESLRQKVDELSKVKLTQWALPFAMRTILTAQEKSNTPGTRLVVANSDDQPPLPPDLSKYSCEHYRGWYHTDETLRVEFFHPDASRPTTIGEHTLDFTYLHKKDEEDYECMSLGEEILKALEMTELE